MYGKIFASLWDGTLATNWPGWSVLVFMIANCDVEGVLDMTPQAISARTGIPLDQVRSAITVLESPDPESRSQDHDGCRIERISETRSWGWRVVNYSKYRAMRDEDQRRAEARDRMRTIRANRSPDVRQGSPPFAHAEVDVDVDVEAVESESKSKDAADAAHEIVSNVAKSKQIPKIGDKRRWIVDPTAAWESAKGLPAPRDRMAMALIGRLAKQGVSEFLTTCAFAHYVATHAKVENPFRYYNPGSDTWQMMAADWSRLAEINHHRREEALSKAWLEGR